MTTSPHHRTLSAHLRDWDAGRIARLLRRRPDLAQPAAPADLAELADRAQRHYSVVHALSTTTLPENRLLQLVVCLRRNVPVSELARALPPGVDLEAVEPILDALEDAALVWRHGERVHCSGSLRLAMPTRFGPPISELVKDQPAEYLMTAIRSLRSAADGVEGLPAPSGGGARFPRKRELVDELEALLAVPDLVEAVLKSLPAETAAVARGMAQGVPTTHTDVWLHSRSIGTSGFRDSPVYQLFERALLLPWREGWTAAQPREVGLALNGGRPVADLALTPPALAMGPSDHAAVDADAAARAAGTLDRLADLLDRWAETPAQMLKSGDLGVAVLKQTATALGVEPAAATTLVELGYLAGLVEKSTVSRLQKRQYVYETSLGPTPAASEWLNRSRSERWGHLAGAWLRAARSPSAPLRRGPDAKPMPALSSQYDAISAPERRHAVLAALASLPASQRTTADQLAAYVYWACPQNWLTSALGSGTTLIGEIYAEAEQLGIVADGALSTFGEGLLTDDLDAALVALEASWPHAAQSFTLQADLTATFVGALEREVLVELRLLADQESTGAASVYRFSEGSLRRALDAGRHAEEILAFLETHATKGVPKPLGYLVGDVARRHGHLQVGDALSFVTSDDPAVLADACSNRRTRKLKLRLLAPTVAVSPESRPKVIDGLRDAGFLPTLDGETAAKPVAVAKSPARRPRAELDEPFGSRPGYGDRRVHPITDDEAAKLAAEVLAGRQRRRGTDGQPRGAPSDARRGATSADQVLALVNDEDHVLKVFLDDGFDDITEPIVIQAMEWDGEHLTGVDVDDGSPVVIHRGDMRGFIDLGSTDRIASGAGRRSRRTTSRDRRR